MNNKLDYTFIYEKLIKKGLLEFTISFEYKEDEIIMETVTNTPFNLFQDNMLDFEILEYLQDNEHIEGKYYMIAQIEFGKHPSTPNDSGEWYTELDIKSLNLIK